jgi:hypothetical protein
MPSGQPARPSPVILSPAATSQSEVTADSKDPDRLNELVGSGNFHHGKAHSNQPSDNQPAGSFDSTLSIASEWKDCAQSL